MKMNIMKHAWVAALLAIITSTVQAQTKKLTLDEAVQLSLSASKQLQLSAAKIAEANALVKQAEEHKLPEVSVGGAALYLPQPSIHMAKKSDATNGGGASPSSEPPKINSAIYGMLNVSQPLFTGFKIKYGIESARYLADAAKLDAENDKEGIVQNAIAAYANLYKADAAINVVKQSLEEARQRVKDYSNLEKNGLMARNDLLKAELAASNLELALLEAQKDRGLANTNMNIMLGQPAGTLLQTQLLPAFEPDAKSLEEWENLALQNRKDLNALGIRAKAAAAGIKLAEADKYPSLALTGGYVAADIPGFLSAYNVVNIGLGVKYNISSLWKNKSKVTQAEARQQQVLVTQAMMNDGIRLQLSKAYQDALLASNKIAVLQKAVEQATENYRIVDNKFKNSLATATDVLDANVARLQAQLNYEFGKVDAAVSRYTLAETAGTLADTFTNSKH